MVVMVDGQNSIINETDNRASQYYGTLCSLHFKGLHI